MDAKFKGNGVLASAVDYFCLVCESRLYNEIDAVAHISKPVHTKNFELTNYFENKDDYVRKIKKWYFCELCNLLLSTATKVRLHVTESQHVEYKNERLLERNGKFVVAFSSVQIHDKSWNGIIDETCVICNTEFEDEKIHINETMHIIKLIQSKTELDSNKNVYRKIDDSSIQCLTCNVVFGLSSIDTHFNQPEHIKLYQEAINSVQDKILHSKNKGNDTNTEENLNDKENKELDKQVISHNNVNEEKDVKQPVTETNVIWKSAENVNVECHKKNAKPAKRSDKEICQILNAKNYITKQIPDKLWCILCQWEVDPSNVKTHTSDWHHQTLLKFHKNRLSRLNATQITSLEKNDKTSLTHDRNISLYLESVHILESIENFQQNGIQLNFDTHTAYCVKCSSSLTFNFDFIENHIKEHTNNRQAIDIIRNDDETNEENTSEGILDSIEHFQKNNIQINFEIQTAFCKKCSTSLDFKKIFIENHIEEHNKALGSNDIIEQPDSTVKLNDIGQDSIKESADCFQKNDILIDFDLQTAVCQKCQISLDFNKIVIENHIKEHANTSTSMSEKKKNKVSHVMSGHENRKNKNTINKKTSINPAQASKKKFQIKETILYTEEDIKKIAEENDMIYTRNSKEVHCNKCNTKIPSFPTNLYEHITGSTHKSNLDKVDLSTDKNKLLMKEPTNKVNRKKVPIVPYIASLVTVNWALGKDVVLNNRICINYFSFSLTTITGDSIKCHVCETTENVNEFQAHVDTLKHSQIFNESLVVIDGDEFIREIQEKGFHCGYCNMFMPTWESMQNHLHSFVHRDSKTACQWRFQQYVPHIQKQFFEDREMFSFQMLNNKDEE